jgi:hypothetical protein
MPQIVQNSGSINVDCDQWGTAQVTIGIPAGSTVTNHFAHWKDLSNIKESKIDSIQNTGNQLVVTGRIRGLDATYTLGVRNCPGGGHGTLELTVDHQ